MRFRLFLESQTYTLKNGRVYKIIDTGKPYIAGEYPEGGFKILAQMPNGNWSYIDNSPDEESVKAFLRAAERLKPLQDSDFFRTLEYFNPYKVPGLRLMPIARQILSMLDREDKTFDAIKNALEGVTKEDVDETLTYLMTKDKVKFDDKRGVYSIMH